MNNEDINNKKKTQSKKKDIEIPKSQRIIGYLFVSMGVFVILILIIGFILRGMPKEGCSFIIIFVAIPASIFHGIRILNSTEPVNVWSWNLERKR